MIYHKTFTGGRLDLEHIKRYPIVEHEFEILDGCNAKDFSAFDGVFFALYAKRGGKLLLTIDMLDGDTSPQDNFIYLSTEQIAVQRGPREYWHECYATYGSPEVREMIFQGVSLVNP